jgi:hypothetical protein
VPTDNFFDIQGLSASSLLDLDLDGCMVYAVGCHGGLPVAGSTAPEDHAFDLPQAFLSQGVLAYVANTGFGWGLQPGIGYSERMVLVLTEEMTRNGQFAVGDAIREAKRRYMMESLFFDTYDAKTSMQWTLFGFPMLKIDMGLAAVSGRNSASASASPAIPSTATPGGDPWARRFGAVQVEHYLPPMSEATPPHLLVRHSAYDLSASGLYKKYDADGDPLSDPGCPDMNGCYYTLKGLAEQATGEHGLSIQPYLIEYSTVVGTRRHGALWTGGTYTEEDDWIPLVAYRISNGGAPGANVPLPRKSYPLSSSPRPTDSPDCAATGSELDSVVAVTGEAVLGEDSTWTERLFQSLDLEGFYYNNTTSGDGNCDWTGPEFLAGDYHTVSADIGTLHWHVPVNEAGGGGVWRVVVVWDDELPDGEGLHHWTPEELAYDAASDRWTGDLFVGNGVSRITYYVQAVDERGNVSALDFDPWNPSQSQPTGVSFPIEVPLTPGEADLTLTWSAAPNPVSADNLFVATLHVTNLGPTFSDPVTVLSPLPVGLTWMQQLDGEGWQCGEIGGVVTCEHGGLTPGAAPLRFLLKAPADAGWPVLTASVASGNDGMPSNNEAVLVLKVIDMVVPGADLALALTASPDPVKAGTSLTLTADVVNLGPDVATAVELSVALPPGVVTAFTSDCDTFEVDGGQGVCTRATLPLGVTSIEVSTFAPTASGPWTAIAAVNDAEPSNNTAASTVEVFNRLPMLEIDGPLNTGSGLLIEVPILLDTDGLDLVGVSFSIDYDESCLVFDPADGDGDGLPDAIEITVLTDLSSAAFDAADTDGEIDILLLGSSLPDGVLVRVTLTPVCVPAPGQTIAAVVAFSAAPSVSFSDPQANDVPGGSTDGVVEIVGGLRGDCNGDGSLGVADVLALDFEIFDGDGDFWLDVPGGSYPGNPFGCDANGDTVVDAGDVSCTILLIFGGDCDDLAPLLGSPGSPRLEVPFEVAAVGGTAMVPIFLDTAGHPLSSLAFSLDVDTAQVFLDGALEDAVRVLGEAGSWSSIHWDETTGELHVLLADFSSSQQTFADGILLEIDLALVSPVTGAVRFAAVPRASFGDISGQSVPGTAGATLAIFADGFESDDTSRWSVTVP